MKIDWKHIFNWDVSSVRAPETIMKNGKVIGYQVVVRYKHHGIDKEFYSVDEPRLYKLWTGPQDAAQSSYREHLRNMAKQQELKDIRAKKFKMDWRHIFNWDVKSVEFPHAVMDSNGRVLGYNVVVTYKYHGKDTEFYSADDERMYTTYVNPQTAAMEAYRAYKNRIIEQNRTR